jgi:DNA (cytosine-5)-methyltransferase 1
MTYDAVDLFAGSGGWDVGMKWLGMTSIGVELDPTACDTRDAAGMNTIRASVQYLSPLWLNCKGFIASPPCQTFSRTGGGSGRRDLEIVSQALRGSARSTARGSLWSRFPNVCRSGRHTLRSCKTWATT